MNLLPKSHEEFSQKEYWDKFFKARGNRAFEWYGEYPELCGHLHKYIKPKDKVLIVGCGNSTLGNDLYDVGHKNITNIDISQVVIRQMLQANKERPDMKFIQMDATSMSFEDMAFTVVLDKGTLDALMPNDNPETVETIEKYFKEITRVLSNGGRYICISLLQEHILKIVLSYFPSNNYMLRIVRAYEPEKKAQENEENSMPVFILIMTKFQNLPRQVLEVNMGIDDKMVRYTATDEIFNTITQVQKAAFVCSGLQRGLISEENEINFELFKPNESLPRYSICVVDKTINRSYAPYAAFIVPQGREADWLFSTTDGRYMLCDLTKNNRLAIISLQRKQEYEDLKAIQNEVEDIVKNLAPASMKDKIKFLSLGQDLGKREIKYEGSSPMSGDYVIEDVDIDGNLFRRLYYLKTKNVIQSEARLVSGKKKQFKIDHNYLTGKYHRYMSIACHMATQNKNDTNIAIIGLGGGGLCSFLRNFIPNTTLISVDIDDEMLKVAKEWFSLKEDDKNKIIIEDGLTFLRNADNASKKYTAILYDVDNKDTTIGMSCPPKAFLEPDIIKVVKNCLQPLGLFIVNIVLRDKTLRPSIIQKLKATFPSIIAYKLTEDLNEIFICSLEEPKDKNLVKKFLESSKNINQFFKSKKMLNECENISENELEVC